MFLIQNVDRHPKKKHDQTLYLQYILDTHDVSAFHDDVG